MRSPGLRNDQGLTRRFILGAGAAAALSFAGCASQPRKRPPNILLLMDDEHRGDAIGADGNKVIRTPHLDRLAAQGALFHRAYASLPSCRPARASLLTGMSPWGHGILAYGIIPQRYKYEKPRMLREAGYDTLAIGKNHFNPQREPHGYHKVVLEERHPPAAKFVSDYDQWLAGVDPTAKVESTGLGTNDRRSGIWPYKDEWHPTYWTAQQGIDYINNYRGTSPFFLKVSFTRPHAPYDPPKRYMDLYADADLPKAQVGRWAHERFGDRTNSEPPDAPVANVDPKLIRQMRQGYYGAIGFVDEQIGRIIETLEKRGLLEDTLILFCADHGEMAGDHHLWRKTYAYEGSARIPMIVRWPGNHVQAKRGQVLNQPVELRDVLPTFLDAAGVSIPDDMDGRSLLSLVGGQTAQWRPWLDLEHGTCYFPENCWTALTDGRFKYIYHAYLDQQQLFDLDADPNELNDLAASPAHAELLKTWRSRMVAHLTPRGEPWVKNGDLARRTKTIMYGPNYPGRRPAAAADV